MEQDAELNGIGIDEVCRRASIHGRAAEVMRLHVEGVTPEEIAERLGVKVGTVHVYLHRAKVKISAADFQRELREFYGMLLHDVLPGPSPRKAKEVLIRLTGPGEGERVSVTAGPIVTVDNLRQAGREGRMATPEAASCQECKRLVKSGWESAPRL